LPGQYEPTSLTQMLSQVTLQQYGSTLQTSSAQALQVVVSFEPAVQTAWLHVPPPPLVQVSPQYFGTSLTQMPSHCSLQQYGSFAQTSPAHVLQVEVSEGPALQTAWLHVPLPPLELPELPPEEEPLPPEDEPLELLLPDDDDDPLEPLLPDDDDDPLEPLLPDDELLVPEPASAPPFGVPHPVGPSYPTPALHSCETLQLPLLPEVTS
jgi:hypothetical protein